MRPIPSDLTRSFHGSIHLRLHHHRRRLGRQRPGGPPDRRPERPRPAAGSGPARLPPGLPDPDAGCAGHAAAGHHLQLGLQDRSRAPYGQPPHGLWPGQGPGWLVADQRHVLHPRQRPGLRPLGEEGRPGRLALPRRAALLPQGRMPGHRSQRLPRRPRPHRSDYGQTRHQPALRGHDRGRCAGRLPAHRRPQRLPAGRLRPDGPFRHPSGPACLHGPRLPGHGP